MSVAYVCTQHASLTGHELHSSTVTPVECVNLQFPIVGPLSRVLSLLWLTEAEAPGPRTNKAGGAVHISKARQPQTVPLPAKHAANRTADSLVTSARSASRQGRPTTAPAKTSQLPTQPSGSGTRLQQLMVKAPGKGKSAVAAASAAASPAAAAAALEQAAASGQLGCPKCRSARYGCKKCRGAYVRSTGTLMPVDRSLDAASFALLGNLAGSAHQETPPSRPLVQSSRQQLSAVQPACSSEAVPWPAAKKQKTTQQAAAAKQAPATGSRGALAQTATSSKPSEPALGAAKGTKRALPASSPALPRGRTDPSAPAAKRSRLSETVTATDVASGSIKRNSNRNAQHNAAVGPVAGDSQSHTQAAVGDATKAAVVSLRAGHSKVSNHTAAAGSAATAQKRKANSPGAAQTGRFQASAWQPNKTSALAEPTTSSKQRKAVGTSSSAAPITAQAGRRAGLKATRSAVGKPASVRRPVAAKRQHPAHEPGVPMRKQAAVAAAQAATPKQAHAARAPKFGTAAKSASVPRQGYKVASVPSKSRASNLAPSPKVMTAAKIQRSASGKAATAAGHAVAEAHDSKLGCSKCRFVPTGCKKCRAKQAGQLSVAAAKRT